ncbi:MAG: hypothetical protein CL849_03560 [Crocinitomicaceae bacterium]|nr:hypothetical protein [Crocinitomicaceae bacterium]
MRAIFLSLTLLLAAFGAAQPVLVDGDVCLDIEVVAIHNEGSLEGMKTYRLYVTLPGPDDIVTTVFGDQEHPTTIWTSTEWYQDENGSQFPCANSPLLFALFPELEFDSWLTIGIDGPQDPASDETCPQLVMSTGSPFATEFENGSGFSIDDDIGSAWFVLPTYSNGLPDEDGRVLLAQLTTDGEIDGVLYLQILPSGNGLLAEVVELPFYGACDGLDLEQCPDEIEAVDSGGCVWEFEVGDFQAGEAATWSFGDDVVQGGHYVEYAFGGDDAFPVSVAYSSNFCPQGVTLQTTVDVVGCDLLDCGLELDVQLVDNDSVIMVVPMGYPEGVELVFTLNGELFQEGGSAITLPFGTGSAPWEVCVGYVSDDCPGGVAVCAGSFDPESGCLQDTGCPDQIWVEDAIDMAVGGFLVSGCDQMFSICEFSDVGSVSWTFGDGTGAQGSEVEHVYLGDGIYDACVTYVSPTCPDTASLCTTVEVSGCSCLDADEAELVWFPDDDGPCSGTLWIEMIQPEDFSIFWDFGDGLTSTGTWFGIEHQYAESGTYEACATVFSPGCPEGATFCVVVVIDGCEASCEPVVLTVNPDSATSGIFEWSVFSEGWSDQGNMFSILPSNSAVLEFGLCLSDGCYDVQIGPHGNNESGVGFDVGLETPGDGLVYLVDGPSSALDGTQTLSFGVGEIGCEGEPLDCSLDIEAVLEPDSSWTLTAVTDSVQGENFTWFLSDGSTLNGQVINHVFAIGSGFETACVTAAFWDCEEVLSQCVDLVVEGVCEDVEVTLDGETLAELTPGLSMAWSLFGDAFDFGGAFDLDPAVGELGNLVLCLPEGCYGISFEFENGAVLDGLPGMTLSLSVGDDEEVAVDLAILEGLIALEFGVMTDCGSSVLETRSPLDGLQLYPNPVVSRLYVTWPEALPDGGLTWRLRDAMGREVSSGQVVASQWELELGRLARGTYFLEVEGGAARQVGRVMVAR